MKVQSYRVSQPVVKEEEGKQALVCQESPGKSSELICEVESTNASLTQPLDPNQLLQVGGSTVAVILSIAFLILVLAKYNEGFISVMMQGKNKDKS